MGCGAAAFRYKAEVTPGMVLIEIIQGGLNGGFLKWKIPIGVNSLVIHDLDDLGPPP